MVPKTRALNCIRKSAVEKKIVLHVKSSLPRRNRLHRQHRRLHLRRAAPRTRSVPRRGLARFWMRSPQRQLRGSGPLAFPLAPLLSLINNSFQIPFEISSLASVTHRPLTTLNTEETPDPTTIGIIDVVMNIQEFMT